VPDLGYPAACMCSSACACFPAGSGRSGPVTSQGTRSVPTPLVGPWYRVRRRLPSSTCSTCSTSSTCSTWWPSAPASRVVRVLDTAAPGAAAGPIRSAGGRAGRVLSPVLSSPRPSVRDLVLRCGHRPPAARVKPAALGPCRCQAHPVCSTWSAAVCLPGARVPPAARAVLAAPDGRRRVLSLRRLGPVGGGARGPARGCTRLPIRCEYSRRCGPSSFPHAAVIIAVALRFHLPCPTRSLS
jgi:hypothetical protein